MKVGTKLSLAFYAIIFVMIVMATLNFINLNRIDDKQEHAFNDSMKQIQLIEDMRYNLAYQGLFLRAYFLEKTDKNEQNLESYAKKLDENILTLQNQEHHHSNDEISTLVQKNDDFNASLDDVIRAIQNNDTQNALALINGPLQQANIELSELTNDLLVVEKQELTEIKQATESSVTISQMTSVIAVLIGAAIGIVLIVLIKRKIVAPLNVLKEQAAFIAAGDLTHRNIVVTAKDEIGQLAQNFNDMKHKLRALIQHVQDNSGQISAVAQQLSASVEEVTASNEEVKQQMDVTFHAAKMASQSAQESANAMEQTAQGVHLIAQSSETLKTTSVNAGEIATHGTAIIEQAKTQIETINDATTMVNDLVHQLAKQTEEIEIITNAITDITEQTNLLALNASIEAARAGEHGKGFAVVAQEVKNLAEQSKSSANAIVKLTSHIQRDTSNVTDAMSRAINSTKQGVTVIADAGKSFMNISGAVDTMTAQIQEISATAVQLSASAKQVTTAVNEIAIGAQASTGSIETIAGAIEEQVQTMQQVSEVAVSLADNATDLQHEIHRFNV